MCGVFHLIFTPDIGLKNARRYFYRLLSGPEPLSTFEKDRAWHISEELNLQTMQKACRVLIGPHDFSSFRAAACQAKSPIRTLDELNVIEVVSPLHFPTVLEREQSNCLEEDSFVGIIKSESELSHLSARPCQVNIEGSNCEPSTVFGMRRQHRCFVVTARARSFLYHQVRLLVGVLKSVGTGELTVPDVERILKAKTVSAASPMAPACGLYLGHVKYNLPSET